MIGLKVAIIPLSRELLNQKFWRYFGEFSKLAEDRIRVMCQKQSSLVISQPYNPFPNLQKSVMLWALGATKIFCRHILQFDHAPAFPLITYFSYLPVHNCQWNFNFQISSIFGDYYPSMLFGRNSPRDLTVGETHEETCFSKEAAENSGET